MKLFKNIRLFVVGTLVVASACDPIEERDTLQNSFDPDDIELEVIQSANGTGNGLTLKMNTPGVAGYWDYNINKQYTDVVNVNYPIPGKAVFTYYVATPYIKNGNPADREYISKSIEVDIDVLDQPLPQAYYDLIGENLEGKTWVFKGTGGDNGLWWYMCPPNDPSAYGSAWWNAGGTCCPPPDVGGRMDFDLDGAANYYHHTDDADVAGTKGSFSFNGDYSKLFVSGTKKILGNNPNGGTGSGEYVIISLTADELILYVPEISGTGWTWVFVPEP